MVKKRTPTKRPRPGTKTRSSRRNEIPPEWYTILDEETLAGLRSDKGSWDYVLRTGDGKYLYRAPDLVSANQIARALGLSIRVYKTTSNGEVLMSYNGPMRETLRA